MPDPTEEFFARLSERGHVPMFESTTATVRVELANGDGGRHWLVAINQGDVKVSHGDEAADLTIRCDRAVFDELAAGRLNPMAAFLRGAIEGEGDPSVLVRFQRLFPAPTGQPRAASGRSAGKRRS
jgi:putative sterol carrier protein